MKALFPGRLNAVQATPGGSLIPLMAYPGVPTSAGQTLLALSVWKSEQGFHLKLVKVKAALTVGF